MKMRKVLVAFLAVICILTSVSTFGAYAEGASRVYAETDISVAQGSYGWAYIYLDDLVDLATLNIAVHYDREKLSVLDHYNSVGCTLYDASNKDGCLQYSYIFDGNGNSEKTNLFYFCYQINEDAEIGNTYFDIVITDAYNTSRQPVDIGGSRCNLTITERPITKECYVYGTYDVSTSVKKEFVLDYYFNTWEIASGSAEISYDSELFEVVEITNGEFLSGKLVDVNSSLKGSVYLSFLATEYNYYSDFLRIRFRTLKNVEETSQITLTFSQLCDLELNTLVCSGFATNMYVNFDGTYTENAPSMSVSASYNAQTDKVIATIKLDENSRLGAGDFVLKFDSDALAYNSAQKGFAPNFFNINDKDAADGILKFSILSLTDITDEQTVLTVVFDVKQACKDNVVLEINGSGLTDSLVNPIMLNFVDASVKMLSKHTEADAVEENRVEATCTEDGSYDSVVYCSVCDSELSRETIVIPAGHVEGEWFTYWEPTCTGTGYRVKFCAVCGWEIASQEIPATGHSPNAVVTQPTCTTQGYTTHTCHCGDSYVDSYVDALGHTEGEWITAYEPTCTETGYKYQICAVCGDAIDGQEIPATGHTAGEWFTHWEPTCTETGFELKLCNVCGCQIDGREIPATGHSHNAVVTQPTCTTQGYTTHTCHCGDSYVDSYVDALGHTEVVDKAVAPTCTTTGLTEGKHCSVCNDVLVLQTVVSALGHSYSAVVIAPTCTEQGYTTYTCNRCDDNYKSNYVEATGHIWAWVIDKAATYEETGLKHQECSVCHVTQNENTVIPVKTHECDYVRVVTTAPTCTQKGIEAFTCSECGDTYTQDIVPTGHSHNAVVTKPTCTEQGYTTYTCHCGDTYVADEVAATGHTQAPFVVENNVAATCTEDGSCDIVIYCAVCDAELSRVNITTPATGHTVRVILVENNVAPTCTADGSYDNVTRCGNCETELSRDTIVVPATGHSIGEWTVSTAPTCTEAGEERRDCANCDHYEANEIAALGHDYSNGGSCVLCGKLSDGAVTGIVAGSAVAVGGGGFSLFWFVIRKKRFNIKK